MILIVIIIILTRLNLVQEIVINVVDIGNNFDLLFSKAIRISLMILNLMTIFQTVSPV